MENGQFQGLQCCFWGQFVTKGYALQPAAGFFSDMGYDVDGVMSELVNYTRGSEYAAEGFSETVSEIVEIVGKTTRTLYNWLSF